MYYPYLRAKQFELLAVREFANEEGAKKVHPIIEPVKKTFNSLNRALGILVSNNLSFSIIMNPQVGDIIGNTNFISENIPSEIKDSEYFCPAFIIHAKTDYLSLIDFIEKEKFQNVLLILSVIKDIEDPNFIKLCELQNVKTFLFEKEDRTLKRKLHGKRAILLKDNFNTQKRNSDYINQDDELFTEEHAFYTEDGYFGFSDYTTIGKDFIDGGRLPYAIAIHLTYKKNNTQVWVKHFVSDTNDDNSNIQGKFGEAAEKAVKFIDEKGMSYLACAELRGYYNEGAYPGLGMIKKISIKNHLELINDLLTQD